MSEDSGCLTCLYPESDDVRLKYHYPIELRFRFDLPLPMSHFSCRRFFLIFTFYLSSVPTPYSWKWRITVQFILVLYICKIIIISLILIWQYIYIKVHLTTVWEIKLWYLLYMCNEFLCSFYGVIRTITDDIHKYLSTARPHIN